MAVLVLASIAAVASANSFLQAEPAANLRVVSKEDVEEALLSELSGVTTAKIDGIEKEIEPMYVALPKNLNGKLDPATVRYALHRYFMQKHGWYINGLGPINEARNVSRSASIMKDRSPSYIQGLFEQRLHGHGLGMHDLAVFAATLSDLIHGEVSGILSSVYSAYHLPVVGEVTEESYEAALRAYLLTYLSGGRMGVTKASDLPAQEQEWSEDYPAWFDTKLWASDLRFALRISEQSRKNPFVERKLTYDEGVLFLQELGHRLGTYQNLECHKLKDQLVDMEDMGTGRVPLSKFYRGGLDGEWQFTESIEYLRHIGALDETNPARKSVVIPNYIKSQSNCLAGSSFYSVCCFDECEDLMGRVEQEIKAPSAQPSSVAKVVRGLQSDTIEAPRNLSTALLSRLDEIAQLHDGRVPLHGRLFAQWMHHAYPRECIFPHVIGATNRMSPDEWMDSMGVDTAEASQEEMALLVGSWQHDQVALTAEAKMEALPWMHIEELVAGHADALELSPQERSPIRSLIALAVLVSSIISMARFTSSAEGGKESKPANYMV